jgi:hypothetical protein
MKNNKHPKTYNTIVIYKDQSTFLKKGLVRQQNFPINEDFLTNSNWKLKNNRNIFFNFDKNIVWKNKKI